MELFDEEIIVLVRFLRENFVGMMIVESNRIISYVIVDEEVLKTLDFCLEILNILFVEIRLLNF